MAGTTDESQNVKKGLFWALKRFAEIILAFVLGVIGGVGIPFTIGNVLLFPVHLFSALDKYDPAIIYFCTVAIPLFSSMFVIFLARRNWRYDRPLVFSMTTGAILTLGYLTFAAVYIEMHPIST